MNLLKESKNQNFYVEKDCLYNINSEYCLAYIKDKYDNYGTVENTTKFYSRGVLNCFKTPNDCGIIFFKNNAKTLLYELHNREEFDDCNAIAFEKGIYAHFTNSMTKERKGTFYYFDGKIKDVNSFLELVNLTEDKEF